NAPRSTVSFVANDLAQAGFSFYRIVRDDSPNAVSAHEDSIANEFFRVRPGARGLTIEDLQNRAELELHFEDDGDRGDEYNYDPFPGGSPITAPISCSSALITSDAVRQRLEIDLEYAIPKALKGDRRMRDDHTEPLCIE